MPNDKIGELLVCSFYYILTVFAFDCHLEFGAGEEDEYKIEKSE